MKVILPFFIFYFFALVWCEEVSEFETEGKEDEDGSFLFCHDVNNCVVALENRAFTKREIMRSERLSQASEIRRQYAKDDPEVQKYMEGLIDFLLLEP